MREALLPVAILCALVSGCSAGGSAHPHGEVDRAPNPEQIAQLENELRSKPSFEAAKTEYQTALHRMADEIVALMPGMRWHFGDNSWGGCSGPYSHTRGKQVYQLIVFTGPIPDDSWPQALQIAKDGAAQFGATHLGTFKDEPNNHDIYISGPDDVDFRFGTQVQAVLSVESDCRISETATARPTAER